MNIHKLHIRDLAAKTICDGHVFLEINKERRFYLMKPGVLVDPAFIRKHAPLDTEFFFHPVSSDEIKNHFKQLLKELHYSTFERDLKKKSYEILDYFQHYFSQGEHFLAFALACFEEFCQVSQHDVLRMHETDMHLFRKAMYSAAFAVIIGIANDYYSPQILKDFYNLTFTLDFGLCDENYSYYVGEACNVENRHPGTGLEWMRQEKASESEIKLFLSHPTLSYDYIKGVGLLAYEELAEVALYQHELANGKGFPRGINKGLISGWESIVLLADSLVEIQDKYEFDINVENYVLNFNNTKLNDLPVGRVYEKFCKGLKFFAALRGKVG